MSTIHKTIEKIRKRGDLNADTIKYFVVKDPKFAHFYLLPKIHKRLHDVPSRPVISKCGYYTENISSFLDFHLQPLAQDVKSFIKNTNDFWKKLYFFFFFFLININLQLKIKKKQKKTFTRHLET